MARPPRHRCLKPWRSGLGLAALLPALLAPPAHALPLRLSLETAAMQDLASGDVAEARLPLFEATDLHPPAPAPQEPVDDGGAAERQWQRGSEPLLASALLPTGAPLPAELELPGDTGRGDIARADEVALEKSAASGVAVRDTFAESVVEEPVSPEPARAASRPAATTGDGDEEEADAADEPPAPSAAATAESQQRRHMIAWLVVPMVLVAALYWASTVIARADAENKPASRRRRRVRRA